MNRGHETSDMNPKYVLYFAVGLTVVAIVVQLGLWWMFRQLEQEQARRDIQPKLVAAPKPVPEPRLQISPQDDLQEMLRQENEILTTYGWIDRGKGTARIPIDRAMQLLLEKEKK
jgi:hypothetical protein